MSDILIVIPSRYHSKRLPGKPLIKIRGVEMIERVALIADAVCRNDRNCAYVVATDHPAIEEFCRERGLNVVMTSRECRNGTERCWDAVGRIEQASGIRPQLIVNLQGDNPLCPPWILQEIIGAWRSDPSAAVYTPCVSLGWDEYAAMVEAKKTTPYSGTTVLVDKNHCALAFSKTVIPSIRKVDEARAQMPKSPVKRHIGLYAYTYDALRVHSSLEESVYEKGSVEGLEQMRFLYNGLKVKMVEADYRGRETTSGVDSEEDIARVEAILEKYGELV